MIDNIIEQTDEITAPQPVSRMMLLGEPVKGGLRISLFSESLHYADAAGSGTPRYDGKISAREFDRDLTLYGYDCHGRLASSQTASPLIGGSVTQDFSTEYTYDRNANLTSLTRHGVTDIVGGRRSYGIQNGMTFSYSGNRLQSAEITADGADYEGRTGVPQFSASGAAFLYDSNGNMISDAVRGITRITYSRLNKPETVTFANGQRQTITYDGFGNKKRTDYSVGPETVIGGDIPADDAYTVSSSRVYAGSHVFADGKLEYSGFPGGYFDSARGAIYYITDWQGNNIAVVDSKGRTAQHATYYPYGEPTVEPSGQRYLFGGDPINYIDLVGKEKICISSDDALIEYTQLRPDNENIAIIMHGTSRYVKDDRKGSNPNDWVIITKPAVFFNILCVESETYDPTQTNWVQIDLISCETGKNNPDGSEPIAQTFSREISNAVIKAPNGTIFNENEKIVVSDNFTILTSSSEKNNLTVRCEVKKDNVWRYFFKGHEINPVFIPLTKVMLFMQNHNILNKAIENIFFICMSPERDHVDAIPTDM